MEVAIAAGGDFAKKGVAFDRTGAADAAARAALRLLGRTDDGRRGGPDLSAARASLLAEPRLQLGLRREKARLARARVALPKLRWLPPGADAPVLLAASHAFHGVRSYDALLAAEAALGTKASGEVARRLRARAAAAPKSHRKKPRKSVGDGPPEREASPDRKARFRHAGKEAAKLALAAKGFKAGWPGREPPSRCIAPFVGRGLLPRT